MTEITSVKQRFGIIGTSELLDRALEVALRVALTDLTVLVTGESGVGKEFFPQVIHAYSSRKHNKYIAVNCAAIPEGTIDSELFGHEKGAFTGATEARKGYFEEADGGTIFLDEVAELPHPTQARLLRVLQTGEFIRVGSSKVQKTNVRVVAATNVNLQEAIAQGRFREDLYYRLGTVPISVPSLRERPEDIPLLFRKFASDVAVQYRMPAVTLDDSARQMLMHYYWRGNIRQLKNVAEQISAIEPARVITAEVLAKYLPVQEAGAPAPMAPSGRMDAGEMSTERELLYKVLFDMRADINELKRMISELMQGAVRASRTAARHPPCCRRRRRVPRMSRLRPFRGGPASGLRRERGGDRCSRRARRPRPTCSVNRSSAPCAATTDAAARPPPSCSCPNVRSIARSRSWALPKIETMKTRIILLTTLCVALLTGCGVAIKYSFSGASIPPDAKTFSVAYFPNNATMVSPILSSTLTDALVDIFSRRTRLAQVDEGGDFAFEGEITNYTSTTSSVSSEEYALLNRLTITVKVRFTNALDEKASWTKTFSAFEDYDSSLLLTEAESTLIPEIVDQLVTDIFQASASNW